MLSKIFGEVKNEEGVEVKRVADKSLGKGSEAMVYDKELGRYIIGDVSERAKEKERIRQEEADRKAPPPPERTISRETADSCRDGASQSPYMNTGGRKLPMVKGIKITSSANQTNQSIPGLLTIGTNVPIIPEPTLPTTNPPQKIPSMPSSSPSRILHTVPERRQHPVRSRPPKSVTEFDNYSTGLAVQNDHLPAPPLLPHNIPSHTATVYHNTYEQPQHHSNNLITQSVVPQKPPSKKNDYQSTFTNPMDNTRPITIDRRNRPPSIESLSSRLPPRMPSTERSMTSTAELDVMDNIDTIRSNRLSNVSASSRTGSSCLPPVPSQRYKERDRCGNPRERSSSCRLINHTSRPTTASKLDTSNLSDTHRSNAAEYRRKIEEISGEMKKQDQIKVAPVDVLGKIQRKLLAPRGSRPASIYSAFSTPNGSPVARQRVGNLAQGMTLPKAVPHQPVSNEQLDEKIDRIRKLEEELKIMELDIRKQKAKVMDLRQQKKGMRSLFDRLIQWKLNMGTVLNDRVSVFNKLSESIKEGGVGGNGTEVETTLMRLNEMDAILLDFFNDKWRSVVLDTTQDHKVD